MGAFWTYDNLNYLTTTKTINYGTDRALRGKASNHTVRRSGSVD